MSGSNLDLGLKSEVSKIYTVHIFIYPHPKPGLHRVQAFVRRDLHFLHTCMGIYGKCLELIDFLSQR